MKKVFILKGLDCPNCSVKIEREVGELDGVSASSLNLMNQSLTVEADEKTAAGLLKKVKKIVKSHEPDVVVSEYGAESEKDSDDKDDGRARLVRLLVGAAVYAVGIALSVFFELPLYFELPVLVLSYIILGADVLFAAVRNIFKGRVFDENFLMSLSTVGAFIIGEYLEAVAVMLFYQIGEFFEDMAVRRSRRSIASLMDIRPDSATVERGGELLTVSPETVEVGEIITVRPGEKVPLDGTVVSGESMLDTRALTGESVPRSVRVGDEVLSGCVNQSGVLRVRVEKQFAESTASKIIDLVENASSRKAPTENFITAFARYYTPAVVILAALLAFIPPIFLGGLTEWIRRGMIFLVISCPCALVISIPLTFFGGIGAASRHGVLVKGSNYLEALSGVKTVVFDKTGTLTEGVFSVSEIYAENGATEDEVLRLAAFAESFSNHLIARSVILAYGKEIDRGQITDYREIPGLGVGARVCGRALRVGNAELMKAENIDFTPCENVGTKVYVAADGVCVGCILISDKLKDDSAQAIESLRSAGVTNAVMLTGDDENIARAVANELKLDGYYARLLPADKVARLEEIDKNKPRGSKLAFVGDGINDAPVLARADVGIAMGGLGSDAAIEAADVVLMTDEPSKLVDAIRVARATKRIVVQNIVIALGIKSVFLILGAFGLAGMWEAVFGDVGVALIAVLNAMRILKK